MPDTSIVPVEGRTTWAPGLREPVPLRPLIHATVHADDYGQGTIEASGAIQAVINACPTGQTVMLSAGTFLCNNHVLINKPVTLMGAGAGLTILKKTNGKPLEGHQPYDPEEAEPIVIIGPNRWPKIDDSTSVNLTGDKPAGALSVAVANTTGFTAGQFVLLDQDDYAAGAWMALPDRNGQPTTARIWASDRVCFQKHDPPEQYVDDPFPDSLTWFSRAGRPLNELKEIASVSGNTITFTTPLHARYDWSKAAQLTRYMDKHVVGAGLENVTLVGGSDGALVFTAAAYCWAKDIEVTQWLGAGVDLVHAFRCEVRDSFIHDGVWSYPGGGGYGLSTSWATSELLLENCILVNCNKVMVMRSSGAGSVVGYCYADNGHIENNQAWVEVGINGTHMVGSHHVLFEGCQSNNYDADNTHGNGHAMTVFRCHLVGRRRDYAGQSNARCAGLMFGSWWHSFIGNVLGEAGQMAGWIYDSTYPWPDKGIYKLGYDPTHWEQAADPKVLSTVLRLNNYNYATGALDAVTALPTSLYLDAKPAFFGQLRWPWVDPFVADNIYTLPARMRYEAWAGGVIIEPPPPPELFCTDGDARYLEGEELSVETKQKDRAKLVAQMTPQGWTLLETEKRKGGALWCRFKCVGKPQI